MIERRFNRFERKTTRGELQKSDHEYRLVRRIVDLFGAEAFGLEEVSDIHSIDQRTERVPDVRIISKKDQLGRPQEVKEIEVIEVHPTCREEGIMRTLRRTKLNPKVDYGERTVLLVGVRTPVSDPKGMIRQLSEALTDYKGSDRKDMEVFLHYEFQGSALFAQVNPTFEGCLLAQET